MWYEDIRRYEWVGHVRFGNHAIHDFTVYLDTLTQKLTAANHDYPEVALPIEKLVEFSRQYSDDYDAQRQLYKLLSSHCVEQLLGWKKSKRS